MKQVILAMLILIVAFSVKAQQDEKAKGILEKVSEKARSFKSLAADFTFSMENKEMEIDEKNEGTIKMKGQKYVVELPNLGAKVFCDGATIWHYMKDGNQVTISDMDNESSELMDPASLFNIYDKGFKSKYIGEKNENGKAVYQIELEPDSQEFDITKVNILISKSDMMIQSAQLFSTDENIYGIIVKQLDTTKDFPDSQFVFNAADYPDVEIIDFR